MATRKEITELFESGKKFAEAYDAVNGHLPLLLRCECYEFFGQPVQIKEANVFDDVDNAEVVIEGRFAEIKTVDFSELEWRSP